MQLTQEAILAARQQIADNAQACIGEAICPATSVSWPTTFKPFYRKEQPPCN